MFFQVLDPSQQAFLQWGLVHQLVPLLVLVFNHMVGFLAPLHSPSITRDIKVHSQACLQPCSSLHRKNWTLTRCLVQ